VRDGGCVKPHIVEPHNVETIQSVGRGNVFTYYHIYNYTHIQSIYYIFDIISVPVEWVGAEPRGAAEVDVQQRQVVGHTQVGVRVQEGRGHDRVRPAVRDDHERGRGRGGGGGKEQDGFEGMGRGAGRSEGEDLPVERGQRGAEGGVSGRQGAVG
jgi:hypothetical protein